MKESGFLEIFKEVAQEIDTSLIVESKTNLYYNLYLKQNLEINVSDGRTPKRGYSAFQTDICFLEKINGILVPRIAIEFKTKITTHDILTYSAKAGKHKSIYPSLRYGLFASEINSIPKRFFMHNEHIDFFIAGKEYQDKNILKKLISNLIEKEYKIIHTLDKINFNDEKFDFYQTNIEFRALSK